MEQTRKQQPRVELWMADDGSMYDVYPDEGYAVMHWYWGGAHGVVAQEANGVPVTKIDDNAFESDILESVVIPEGVTEIGNYAFEGCKGLKSVALPQSLERIGERAFASCKALQKVALPQGLKWIGHYAFGGCDALEKPELPKGIEYAAPDAFYRFEWHYADDRTRYLLLPDEGCAVLHLYKGKVPEAEIPREMKGLAVTRIGSEAFSRTAIRRAVIPEGVREIGEFAFCSCEELESVTLPGTLRRIGTNAFANCPRLAEIALPAGIEFVAEGAFDETTKVTRR